MEKRGRSTIAIKVQLGRNEPKRVRVSRFTPLLAELREGKLVDNLEALIKSASDAAVDIHKLQHEVREHGEAVGLERALSWGEGRSLQLLTVERVP